MSQDLKSVIEAAWEARDGVNTGTTGEVRDPAGRQPRR